MKNLKLVSSLLIVSLWLVSFSCEEKDCCVMPAGSELHGNWEFKRVHFGFTNTTKTAAELDYTERLEIDGTNSRLRRYRDGKEAENTLFTISEQGTSKIITFEDEMTYSYYTILAEDDKTVLSLYERSPVGSVLADGGEYYYEKK